MKKIMFLFIISLFVVRTVSAQIDDLAIFNTDVGQYFVPVLMLNNLNQFEKMYVMANEDYFTLDVVKPGYQTAGRNVNCFFSVRSSATLYLALLDADSVKNSYSDVDNINIFPIREINFDTSIGKGKKRYWSKAKLVVSVASIRFNGDYYDLVMFETLPITFITKKGKEIVIPGYKYYVLPGVNLFDQLILFIKKHI